MRINRVYRAISIIFFMMFAVQSIANTQTLVSANEGHAEQTAGQAWLLTFISKWPSIVCLGKHSIAAEHHISEKQCIAWMNSDIAQCAKDFEKSIPANISPEEGGKIGDQLGQCAGNLFFKRLV